MSVHKIAVVLPSFSLVSPVRAAFRIVELLLSRYGFKFIVISLDSFRPSEPSIHKDLVALGVTCYSLESNSFLSLFSARNRLIKILRRESCGIVISFLFRPDVLLSTISYVYKVSSVRNMISEEYISQYPTILGRLFGWVHERSLKRFDTCIVMSRAMHKYFLSRGFSNENTQLIYNFLNEDDLVDKSSIDFCTSIRSDRPYLVTVSSLIRRKNVKEIISASLFLMALGVEFDLVIIGDGEERVSLESLVINTEFSGNIHFLGHISNPLPYIKNAKGFVMASFSEGVSRSLMEALFLKVPCVVRDIPGNDELIFPGETGYLFSDFQELCNAMKKIITSTRLSGDLPKCFGESLAIDQYAQLLSAESIVHE